MGVSKEDVTKEYDSNILEENELDNQIFNNLESDNIWDEKINNHDLNTSTDDSLEEVDEEFDFFSQYNSNVENSNQKKKKRKKFIIIGSVLAVFVIIVLINIISENSRYYNYDSDEYYYSYEYELVDYVQERFDMSYSDADNLINRLEGIYGNFFSIDDMYVATNGNNYVKFKRDDKFGYMAFTLTGDNKLNNLYWEFNTDEDITIYYVKNGVNVNNITFYLDMYMINIVENFFVKIWSIQEMI